MRVSQRSAEYFFALGHAPETVNTKLPYLKLLLDYSIAAKLTRIQEGEIK
jgi:hypothetical protein